MADKHDIAQFGDISAALGLLSRLPVSVDTERATARGARAAWAYSVAGLILGALACTLGQIALWLGLPAPLAAGLTLAALVTLTGAMHEDGLADTADGFWGGWDKINRLKIMKDSHIGTYGTLALILGLGLRWQGLTIAAQHDMLWPATIAATVLSRAVMVPVMATLPHARDTGLSHSVGKPPRNAATLALTLAAIVALILWQFSALWLLATAAAATLACAALAKAKIGGQTGDVLGATQQITEITLLLTLAALLT